MKDMTHKARWDALMGLLDAAVVMAKDCGPERAAAAAGDESVNDYGGHEWCDFETKLAAVYVHLGGDLSELAHAVGQPWAQELQEATE